MENNSQVSPPHFMIGPRTLKDRVFSFCNPLQIFNLSKNRGDFLEACQNHDLDKIKRLWPKIGGFNWSIYAPQYSPLRSDKYSPLDVCIKFRNLNLAEFFLKNGADPNFKESLLSSKPPCVFETFRDVGRRTNSIDIEILKLLLKNGVHKQINKIWNPSRGYDKYKGNNILHVALKKGVSDEVIELLLKNGADPLIENKDSDNAFSLLRNKNRDSTLKILESYIDKSNLQKNLPKVQIDVISKSEPSRVKRI